MDFNKKENKYFHIINKLYDKTKLVSHQIDEYNNFINFELREIINTFFPIIEKDFKIYLEDVYVQKPCFTRKNIINSNKKKDKNDCIFKTDDLIDSSNNFSDYITTELYPNEARLRNINYEGDINISITVEHLANKKRYDNICIGKIPIMLGSELCILNKYNKIENNECINDHGGYFIIKGKERVLVSQIRKAYNKIYVSKGVDKYIYLAEIRSINSSSFSVLIQLKMDKNKELFFSLPHLKVKSLIPAGVIFKLLKISKNDMLKILKIKKILLNHIVILNLIKQYDLFESPEQCIVHIITLLEDRSKSFDDNKKFVLNTIEKCLFYHIENINNFQIAIHLANIIKKIFYTSINLRNIDDVEHLANKRIDSTSSLLSSLFRILLKQYIKIFIVQLKNKNNFDILLLKENKIITKGFNHSFMTGNWNIQKSTLYTRLGVSQVLSVQNYGARVSHLRRLMLPISKKNKNYYSRQLHSTHFSFICPYETPEGVNAGILLNMSLFVEITNNENTNLEYFIIHKFKNFKNNYKHNILIILNGNIIGTTENDKKFIDEFNYYRDNKILCSYVSICYIKEEEEIQIWSDKGRLIRPFINLKYYKKYKNIRNMTINEMINKNIIIYLDSNELEYETILLQNNNNNIDDYKYMEICPSSTLMGLMASLIPFSNHSQSPRNVYQSSMGKQSIGFPLFSYNNRYDTTLNILNTPHKMISSNKITNVVKMSEMSNGQYPIVLISTFKGFNQEDSIILNKSSIDRGLFYSTTYKTIIEEERKNSSVFDLICLPEYKYRNRSLDYSYLNDEGIVWKKNLFLTKGVVIIGKVSKKIIRNEQGNKIINIVDSSIYIKEKEEGYLDSVLITLNNDGIKIIKIRIRKLRIPEVGDKFSSSTAQKGICGMIFRQEDMPFDKDGITPDLIINPHAIPSRMTINMLIEMCFNIHGCIKGKYNNTTPFEVNVKKELEYMKKELKIEMFESSLYNASTGEKIKDKMFMAPCFYQRLKHLVSDKIHTRETGPLDNLTRQPVAGRSKDGGLRFGEMERDCMLSHGSTRILKECLFDKSDKYFIPLCKNCGYIIDDRITCKSCNLSNKVTKSIPYATKLLYQELLAMGINLKIT